MVLHRILAALLLYVFMGTSTPLASQTTVTAHGINPHVLKAAMAVKKNAEKKQLQHKSVMAVVDYSLPSNQKRLWIIDTRNNKVLLHTFVAHGRNSGNLHMVSHSNRVGSFQTSIGVYVTGNTYAGKHGLSLDLHGLEAGLNDKMHQRRVVIHGSNYVGEQYVKAHGTIGRSHGCLAVSRQEVSKVINYLKEGALVVAYYPDPKWLKQSIFLAA